MQVTKDDLKAGVRQYIGSTNEDDYMNIIKVFGMSNYDDKNKVLGDDRKLTWFVKGILNEAFEIEILDSTKSRNKESEYFATRCLICGLQEMIKTYNPDIEDHNGHYMFIE